MGILGTVEDKDVLGRLSVLSGEIDAGRSGVIDYDSLLPPDEDNQWYLVNHGGSGGYEGLTIPLDDFSFGTLLRFLLENSDDFSGDVLLFFRTDLTDYTLTIDVVTAYGDEDEARDEAEYRDLDHYWLWKKGKLTRIEGADIDPEDEQVDDGGNYYA